VEGASEDITSEDEHGATSFQRVAQINSIQSFQFNPPGEEDVIDAGRADDYSNIEFVASDLWTGSNHTATTAGQSPVKVHNEASENIVGPI